MRIIAGEFRGHPLKSLKGLDTRPTTDRVREALMSSVFSARHGFAGERVLDAFAGSGALGLECLSRGAEFALFCEQNYQAFRIIEENIKALKLDSSRYRIRRGDTFTLPQVHLAPFDLLFFDPPYAFEAQTVIDLIASLDAAGLVVENALLYYEFAKKDKQSVLDACVALEYSTVSCRDYGDTSIITLRKETK
ncbi:MAG: 16S rRNA (guanine(966)-N(2))-methyltransferase RsmD [Eggerthellaceae bacterium]